MKQDNVFEATRKATEIPLKFTRKVMEKSKRLRNPSAKAAKIGSTIGCGVGCGLLLIGTAQLAMGRLLPAAGSLAAGGATIVSNLICKSRKKLQ